MKWLYACVLNRKKYYWLNYEYLPQYGYIYKKNTYVEWCSAISSIKYERKRRLVWHLSSWPQSTVNLLLYPHPINNSISSQFCISNPPQVSRWGCYTLHILVSGFAFGRCMGGFFPIKFLFPKNLLSFFSTFSLVLQHHTSPRWFPFPFHSIVATWMKDHLKRNWSLDHDLDTNSDD